MHIKKVTYQAKDTLLGNPVIEMSELLSHVPCYAVLRTEKSRSKRLVTILERKIT